MHRARVLEPPLRFAREVPPASRRQLVAFHTAEGVGHDPLRVEQPLPLEAMERRVERPLVDAEGVLGDLANALREAPAV